MSEALNITVWWLTAVEVHSAIARLNREGRLNTVEVRFAKNILEGLKQEWQEIVPSDEVRDKAAELLDVYPLRAADSLQLAAATVWCNGKPKGRAFLCADAKLSGAAEQVGFRVVRP
jgi:hypothetical protein